MDRCGYGSVSNALASSSGEGGGGGGGSAGSSSGGSQIFHHSFFGSRSFATTGRKKLKIFLLSFHSSGRLLAALRALDAEDDVNRVTAYFSYEHFYVIYCKFWVRRF